MSDDGLSRLWRIACIKNIELEELDPFTSKWFSA